MALRRLRSIMGSPLPGGTVIRGAPSRYATDDWCPKLRRVDRVPASRPLAGIGLVEQVSH
ncbi:hypothetical protein B005_1873 [Nocardiopsis alba ATCC BAA-2165]|uniref:Uncharacterized protein n=1 Tax=Nocardiopsis alba (strain ATCC BAA-2165 / BE74) TaxID=1205910 RepID=J7LDY9_NOCAA|nr:hypothetical protein B005_1873 [Nocardiopsis alba ATCC BAA-2165]